MSVCVIQYFGLGDCLFEQTVVRKIAKNNPIIWPVEPHLLEGLNRAFPDIAWVDRTCFNVDYNQLADRTINGIRYLPLRFAEQMLKVPYSHCMAAKYQLYDMDYRTWKQQAMWVRDREKENSLFKRLGLEEGMEYTLVNRFFGTESQLIAQIEKKGVEMCTIEGYSLMDWAKVIENATEIHTVSTSLFFILEQLTLKAPEVHIYPRKPIEIDFRNIEYLFDKHTYIQHL